MKSTEMTAVGSTLAEYLSPAQVAALLPGLTENALAIRRHRHMDPVFCRFGRTVVYPLKDLQSWIDACTVKARQYGR